MTRQSKKLIPSPNETESKDYSLLDMKQMLTEIVGIEHFELAWSILVAGKEKIDVANNILALQTLLDSKPKDATEARFAIQAAVLFDQGMKCLKRAENADMICHVDHYSNRAIKLLRLHNETIMTLARYRRGCEQRVIVTHSVVAQNAIVNHFDSAGGIRENQGATLCSKSVVQEHEQSTIDHVVSRQWLMDAVAYMEVNQQDQGQKKVSRE